MKNFLLDLVSFVKFKKIDKLKVGFFCENKYIFEYIKPYVNKKANKKKIILISFEKIEFEAKNVIQFTFLTNFFREIVFLSLCLKYLYTSTPGLNQNLFKRSRLGNCKYIYLQHSLCSMTMIYPKNSFNSFDAIQVVTNYQFDEMHEIRRINRLKLKIFKSNYLFLKEKIFVNDKKIKKNVLIAPSWNTNFYKNNFHKKIISLLNKNNISFDLRPHPMSIKKREITLDEIDSLKININNEPDLNFFQYQILISDWSGILIEYYVFDRNILLIDSKKKILNEEYTLLKNQPAEIRLRKKISKSFSFNNLEDIVLEIKKFIKKKDYQSNQIDKFYFDL